MNWETCEPKYVTKYLTLDQLREAYDKTNMDYTEFINWLAENAVTTSVYNIFINCISNAIAQTLISTFGDLITIAGVIDTISNAIEASEYEEMVLQMQAYDGRGAMKVVYKVNYDSYYEAGTRKTYYRIISQTVSSYSYGANY